MTITETILTPPTITVNGRLITVDALGKQVGATAEAADHILNKIDKTSAASDMSWTNQGPLMFLGPVTITVSTGYTLKEYGSQTTITDKVSDKVFVGKDAERTDDRNLTNNADIEVTLNGKNPAATKTFMYKGPFVINNNLDSCDDITIKAKVNYQGKSSAVRCGIIKIIDVTPLTKNSL